MATKAELKEEINKMKDGMRMILSKLYDAEIQLLDYKNRTEKLEGKIENRELKIKQLEDSLEQKIIETEIETICKDEKLKQQAEVKILYKGR